MINGKPTCIGLKTCLLLMAMCASDSHARGSNTPQRFEPCRVIANPNTDIHLKKTYVLDSHGRNQKQFQSTFATNPASLSRRGGDTSAKLSNLKTRTISAVVMLAGLVLWIDTFREKGLIALVLVIQAGLYREGTDVVKPNVVFGEKKTKNQATSSIKWWWFFAYNTVLLGPRLFATRRDGSPFFSPSSMYLCSFLMVAAGIISFVITLNNSMAFSYEFQLALREVSLYHLAIAFLVVPSSFWIATIQDFGMKYVLYSLYLVMINDTMAYVFGICCGKHALLPTISPKKTWEGFMGALGSTLAVSVWLWKRMGLESGVDMSKHALAIAAYCSIVAPFGGFVASIVKRAYGKKDFSNMIAGHGGFIDRLDCHIATAPFMYLYLKHFVLPGKH